MAKEDINARIKKFLDVALRRFLVQDYNEAIRELKAAEVLDKNNPEILYNLGINYTRLGLYNTAMPYFERLLNLSAAFINSQEIRKIAAYIHIKQDNFDSAESLVNQVIRLDPSDASAHNMKGYCLEKKGNIDEAILAYQAILDLEEDNINACNSLAYLLAYTEKDINRAIQLARKACKAYPDNPAYCDTLGFILLKKNDFKNAQKFLKKAAKLAPFSDDIREHLKLSEKP